jgi:hypothetical protein
MKCEYKYKKKLSFLKLINLILIVLRYRIDLLQVRLMSFLPTSIPNAYTHHNF